MNEAINNVVSQTFFQRLPKWLRITLTILSIITLVYWVGVMVYKMLSIVRIIGAFIFEKRNYWTFLCCILILLVGSLLIAQFYLELNPFGKFVHIMDDFLNSLK